MNTFLLIIIAIGVLLASEAGQDFLDSLSTLALVAGGLFLTFWIIVIAVVVFKNNWETIKIIIAVVFYGWLTIYFINQFYKKLKTKEMRATFWKGFKSSIKKVILEIFSRKGLKNIFYVLFIVTRAVATFFLFFALLLILAGNSDLIIGTNFYILLICFVITWAYTLIRRNEIKKYTKLKPESK